MRINPGTPCFKALLKNKIFIAALTGILWMNTAKAGNLDDVLKSGTLRHLGILYANFVTPDQTGLDVELIQQFAKHLGVEYQFVESAWPDIISHLTGKKVKPKGDDIEVIGTGISKGDIISTGFTILPWRKKIVDFSEKTFPSGIWLIARSDVPLTPILPTGNITKDIDNVKKKLSGITVLGFKDSCIEPNLYGIKETGAVIRYFSPDRDLRDMIPSVMAKMTDTTLMDVPVALVALAKWPGRIKVIGPISEPQDMACAFSKDSPKLKQAFDLFFDEFKRSGDYRRLVEIYYPSVFTYYPDFL